MAKRGRRPVLDEFKRREILAILAVGGSRRTAASYVGCALSTIQNTADRDLQFTQNLGQAEHQAEIAYLKSIQKAARKEQYWRAAAWVLERKNPDDFARRRPNVFTPDQITLILARFAEIVVNEVPVAAYRKNVLKKLDAMIVDLRRSVPKEPADAKN
ncbi:MAG TPA: hypothetical protein VMY37_35855 [Thermoguttaceae bacterium]|nr:hypothetical protein [Thermoguttaceae bacterium]